MKTTVQHPALHLVLAAHRLTNIDRLLSVNRRARAVGALYMTLRSEATAAPCTSGAGDEHKLTRASMPPASTMEQRLRSWW